MRKQRENCFSIRFIPFDRWGKCWRVNCSHNSTCALGRGKYFYLRSHRVWKSQIATESSAEMRNRALASAPLTPFPGVNHHVFRVMEPCHLDAESCQKQRKCLWLKVEGRLPPPMAEARSNLLERRLNSIWMLQLEECVTLPDELFMQLASIPNQSFLSSWGRVQLHRQLFLSLSEWGFYVEKHQSRSFITWNFDDVREKFAFDSHDVCS